MKKTFCEVKNKKGMTLIEVMVVMIIIAAMVAMAYPSYLSALEKARATEAVKVIANVIAAQAKYRGEEHEGADTSFEDTGYARNFKALDVEITGKDKTVGATKIENEGQTLDTANFIYQLTESFISAESKSHSYDYLLNGKYATGEVLCIVQNEDDGGKKVCASLGKRVAGSPSEFRIE